MNNRLQVLGVIILDIALILYLIVFLHDLTIDMPTIKEMIIILNNSYFDFKPSETA